MRLADRPALVAAMTARGMSCARLASLVGCSKSMVGHLRSGRVSTCTERLAVAIEHALGVEYGSLFVAEREKELAS